jgi:excisionase family DNA binding protein
VSSGVSDDERLLTVREVADELRLTQQTVRQWIRDAKLPAIRAGQRKYLVRRSDLRRVIVLANGTTYQANAADSPLDAPPTDERELWDLASHARPPR